MSSLYKYVTSTDAVPFLLRGTAKFTPVAQLNDPAELVPNVIVEEVLASLEDLRQNGYSDEDMLHLRRQGKLLQRLAPQFQAIDVPATKERANAVLRSPFYESVSRLEQLLTDTAREISSKVGLFCLSRRYDSLPMWAHYAGNAKGVVVEFRNLAEVFHGDDTGILYAPIPVRYEREHTGVTFAPESHESLFFSKFQDWSYEEEVRIVVPLDDCRVEPVNEQDFYLYNLPPTSVARLILGWNMSDESAEEVRTRVLEINPDVEVAQATIVRGRVSLNRSA